MAGYPAEIEGQMQRFFGGLSAKARRRYAAIEAAQLGHGGSESIARVWACDPKTLRQGLHALEEAEDARGRLSRPGAQRPSRRQPYAVFSPILSSNHGGILGGCRRNIPAMPLSMRR